MNRGSKIVAEWGADGNLVFSARPTGSRFPATILWIATSSLTSMRELDQIVNALHSAASCGESVVLATVMSVEGSVYRGTGARMIVAASGETIGAVSGG